MLSSCSVQFPTQRKSFCLEPCRLQPGAAVNLHSIDRTVTCQGSGSKRKARARRPGLFEVQRINPPPKSLGIHSLPVNTHNGDQITIDDQDFVVTSLVLQYKLVGGRYQRDHNRLEVQQTSRYIVNLYYESLLERSA